LVLIGFNEFEFKKCPLLSPLIKNSKKILKDEILF